MLEEFYKNIREFNGKAIIIHPSKKYNAYAFYQFEEMILRLERTINAGWDDELINDMKTFLPN